MGTLARLLRPADERRARLWRDAALAGILVLAVATALFAGDSVLHFWRQVGPIYRNRGLGSRLDFSWFFYGMQTALEGVRPAARLYDVAAQDLWMQLHRFPYDHLDMFGYPPPFALLFAPLAALRYAAARQLWTQINLAALAIGLAAAAWHAGPRGSVLRRALLVAGALWAQPLVSNFYWGQPNALILALVALGLWAVMREHPRRWTAALGGAAIGLGAVLKLTPAVVLAYLAARWLVSRRSERGQAALWAAAAGWATVGVTCAASGAAFGWSVLGTYLHQAIPAVERSSWAHGPAPFNQSFRGILMVWPHPAHWLTHAADAFGAGVFLLALALVALRPRLDPRLEAALAALLVLLCSPSLEDHHFTVAVLPWMLLGGYLLERAAAPEPRRWRAMLVPACAFGLATVSLVAPALLGRSVNLAARLTAGLRRPVGIAVPAGRYDRVYVLGAASYGPVRFTLGLRYRGGAEGSVAADWPDWWSPGHPLQPAVSGEAVGGGRVANARVGLYAFGYPVAPGAPLVGLDFPNRLPRQNGGQEALHVVAVTVRQARAGGGFVAVPVPFDVDGIVPAAGTRVAAARSFDGVGHVLYVPSWRGGTLDAAVGGTEVPFSLPPAGTATDVLNAPPPASAAPQPLPVVLQRAPLFVSIAALFAGVWLLGAVEAKPEPAAGAA